ncbi:MAG: TlpA family protein disulfide reductase [Gammaproteobacteria bacterium]|nr:TlpA family protein disulfide reductase [Gammaproteobacteria bacterium]
MLRRFMPLLLLAIAFSQPGHTDSAEPQSLDLTLSNDEIISITRFGNQGDRILWIPSEYGVNKERHFKLLRSLSELHYEVWLVNLHESYFIPPGRSSYTRIPAEDIAELIQKSLPLDNRKLFIVATGRGAVLSLLAIRHRENTSASDNRPGGIIMLHPNFQADTPTPGEAIQYLPIVDSAQLPAFIIQPKKSNKYWYLEDLVARLSNGGSHVYTQVIDQASDGFVSRPDVNKIEEQKASELPLQIARAIRVLAKTAIPASRKLLAEDVSWEVSPVAETLQPYAVDSLAPGLQLDDTAGKRRKLQDYDGKVVLLNFWASWCPPCVEEIPSLGRLQKAFSKEDLVVLSVDIGESKKEVENFLQQAPAEFPVLLDPDGSMVKPWKVIALPMTFVIDRNGMIQLAYFGGLQWDNPDVVAQLQKLVQQKQ